MKNIKSVCDISKILSTDRIETNQSQNKSKSMNIINNQNH